MQVVMMNNRFLRSRVARRVFLLFVVCALLPMATFTVLSFIEVSRELQAQHTHDLQQSAKSLALELFERLTMLDSDLQIAAMQRPSPSLTASPNSHFTRVFDWDQNDPHTQGGPLSTEELAHLHRGQSLVRITRCTNGAGAPCVVMLKAVNTGDASFRLMAGEVNGSYLWSADQLPPDTAVLVLTANHDTLFSSDAALPATFARSSAPTISRFLPWQDSAGVDEFANRDLYLRAQFLASNWNLIVRRTDRSHFLALQRFRKTLLLSTLLAIWIVVLLSSIQIRRTMVPLDQLKDATRSVAEQNFGAHVSITSADEFQDLGASFNSMATRLGRQFHLLRIIGGIDQAVLSSSNLDSIAQTTLASISQILACDCSMIATFEFTSNDLCIAKLHVRERSLPGMSSSPDRVISSSIPHELPQARSLKVVLDRATMPEFLLPLAEQGMQLAEVFPILIDGKLFASLVCANAGPEPMSEDDNASARAIADRLAVGFSNVSLIDALEQLNWGTLTALARAIDAKSAWTAGHSERVTQMALRIAQAMGLSSHDLQVMQRGGLLHDIGKIGTPLEILDKPGKLTDREMAIMREHVQTGVRILEPVAAFAEALPIVAQHHEWFNGQGYPAGLAGEEISLYARIFAVADCYDALISDRPYRGGLPRQRVIQILAAGSGKQFDPSVVKVFLELYSDDTPESRLQEIVRTVGQTS